MRDHRSGAAASVLARIGNTVHRLLALLARDLPDGLAVELELSPEHLLIDGPRARPGGGEVPEHHHVHGGQLVVVRVLLHDGKREALGPGVE